MDKTKQLLEQRRVRSAANAALVLLLSATLSGCFLTAARWDFEAGRGAPWWCQGPPDLSESDCYMFSAYLDIAVDFAYNNWALSDFMTAGATAAPSFTHIGMGQPYILGSTAAFDPAVPNVIFYEDSLPDSRPVAVGWAVDDNGGAPAGFTGNRENWTLVNGIYYQPVWVLRGFQNHGDVFATTHLCLPAPLGANILTATTDSCYVNSHTEPFEVLVTNDDGVMAPGIDALVEGLYGLSNITINVVAPNDEQSGSGDGVTGPGFVVGGVATTTASGRPATGVTSTDLSPPRNGSGSPADSVIYALNTLMLSPDLVMSGTNAGQNISLLSNASGTVGAARTAVRRGFDAIATSTGGIHLPPPAVSVEPDFVTGVAETLNLLEEWRLGEAGPPHMEVPSINIPTCEAGSSLNGVVNTVVANVIGGRSLVGQAAQDCTSTEPPGSINDDIDAFNFGYTGIADVGRDQPPNWP